VSRLLRVRFNGEERELPPGFTVRHLLTPEDAGRVLRRELAVVDGRGHEHGLGGALQDGAVLTLRVRPPS
jgi:hypothetical protein